MGGKVLGMRLHHHGWAFGLSHGRASPAGGCAGHSSAVASAGVAAPTWVGARGLSDSDERSGSRAAPLPCDAPKKSSASARGFRCGGERFGVHAASSDGAGWDVVAALQQPFERRGCSAAATPSKENPLLEGRPAEVAAALVEG
jgi:hypothetical protein